MVRSSSPNHIDTECKVGGSACHLSWTLLLSLCQEISLPWLCVEDFNEVLSSSEQLGGVGRKASQMNGFQEAVHDCELVDLGFVGCDYTWTDDRDDEVRCPLDRAFATQAWIQLFPHSRVCHLNPSKSVHLPIVVEIRNTVAGILRKSRRFQFEEMWLQEGSCEDTVAMAWSIQRKGSPLTRVCDKIKATRVALLEWQRTSFGNAKTEIAKVRDKLGVIFEHPPAPDLHESGGVLMQQLDNLLGREETFWRQRARTCGLRKGIGIQGFSILVLRIGGGRTLLRACEVMMLFGMTRQKVLKIR